MFLASDASKFTTGAEVRVDGVRAICIEGVCTDYNVSILRAILRSECIVDQPNAEGDSSGYKSSAYFFFVSYWDIAVDRALFTKGRTYLKFLAHGLRSFAVACGPLNPLARAREYRQQNA